MSRRLLAAVALTTAALLPAAPAIAGPGPVTPHTNRCAGMGWHDRNLCGPLGRLPWPELVCAALYRHDATVYRTDARCVPFAVDLIR